MRNFVAALTGALMAAQASLFAKWPENPREWTLFGLTTAIGLVGGLSGKGMNSVIRNKEKEQQ